MNNNQKTDTGKFVNLELKNQLLTKVEKYCDDIGVTKRALIKIAVSDFLDSRLQNNKREKDAIF